MLAQLTESGHLPERVSSQSGQVQGRGRAALPPPSCPLSRGLPAQVTLRKQVSDHGLDADAYYGSVLTLFGAGWDQGRYRFAADGTLQPDWSESCQAE